MIETTFFATSEKLWPGASRIFGGPRNSSAQKRAKKASMAARPAALPRPPLRRLGAVFAHGEALGGIVEMRVETGQPLVLHQHEKALLGQIGGRRGRKSARPVLDGKAPVARERRADGERRRGQALRRQALHGVAVDGVDGRGGHWSRCGWAGPADGLAVRRRSFNCAIGRARFEIGVLPAYKAALS